MLTADISNGLNCSPRHTHCAGILDVLIQYICLVAGADQPMASSAEPSHTAETTDTLEKRTEGLELDTDEGWELKEGIPQFSDPFIQKCY